MNAKYRNERKIFFYLYLAPVPIIDINILKKMFIYFEIISFYILHSILTHMALILNYVPHMHLRSIYSNYQMQSIKSNRCHLPAKICTM